jgi:hypothetical protein
VAVNADGRQEMRTFICGCECRWETGDEDVYRLSVAVNTDGGAEYYLVLRTFCVLNSTLFHTFHQGQ